MNPKKKRRRRELWKLFGENLEGLPSSEGFGRCAALNPTEAQPQNEAARKHSRKVTIPGSGGNEIYTYKATLVNMLNC